MQARCVGVFNLKTTGARLTDGDGPGRKPRVRIEAGFFIFFLKKKKTTFGFPGDMRAVFSGWDFVLGLFSP